MLGNILSKTIVSAIMEPQSIQGLGSGTIVAFPIQLTADWVHISVQVVCIEAWTCLGKRLGSVITTKGYGSAGNKDASSLATIV